MSKKRTYEETLCENMKSKLIPYTFFDITKGKDKDGIDLNKEAILKRYEAIKYLIDTGHPFELNEVHTSVKWIPNEFIDIPYHKMKPLPQGVTVKKIEIGIVEHFESTNGKQVVKASGRHETVSYQVFRGDKLIAIES